MNWQAARRLWGVMTIAWTAVTVMAGLALGSTGHFYFDVLLSYSAGLAIGICGTWAGTAKRREPPC